MSHAKLIAAPLFALLGCGCALPTDATPPLSPGQSALLREFREMRPDFARGDGVWMLSEWDTDSGVAALVPPGSSPGNAAAHFARLEKLFPDERETLLAGGVPDGVEELLRAAAAAECELAPDYYPPFTAADASQPDFVILRLYLGALLRQAERAEWNDGDPSRAERCYRAAIACGRHLTRSRTSLVVYMTGIIFKIRGAQAYEKFLRRQRRAGDADLLKRYVAAAAVVLRLFHWKANSALGAWENFAGLPVAVEVAYNDAEPCWRAEAVIRLAIFRHGDPAGAAADPAWQRVAEQALERVAAGDPSPNVRRLAAWSVANIRPGMFTEPRNSLDLPED